MTSAADQKPAEEGKSLKSLLSVELDERKRWLLVAAAAIGAWLYLKGLHLLPGAICLLGAYLFLPAHAKRFLRIQGRLLLVQVEARSESLLAEYRQTTQDPKAAHPLARDWSEDDTLTEADGWPVARAVAPPVPVGDLWAEEWPVQAESERSNTPDSHA